MATFTNQATLSSANGVVNSNIVTGELLEELSLNKTAVNGNYSAGDTVTYAVNLVNSGTADFNAITLTDDLGAFDTAGGTRVTPLEYVDGSLTYFVNGTAQAGAAAAGGPPLIITGINVPAGGSATVIYNARVNNFAPLGVGETIRNTVTATGDGITTDVAATADITANPAPELQISKAINPAPIYGSGPLTYSFVITNTGNTEADAADALSVSDTFDPILNITNVSLDGNALSDAAGDYTYNPATGEFTTTAGRITIPAATYQTDENTGEVTITPARSTLTVTGTIA